MPNIRDIDLNALNTAVQNQSGVISKLFPTPVATPAPRTVQRAPGAASGISALNNAPQASSQGFPPIIRKLADEQKGIAAPATQQAPAQPAAQVAPASARPSIAAPQAGLPGLAKPAKPGPISSIAQPPAQPVLTPTLERPFDGLAAYQNRLGQEQRLARQQAETAYHANENQLALNEYKQKFGVDFSPKYDGDRPENYRNYAQVDAARKRFAALDQTAPRTLTPEQANQTFTNYEQSPEAAQAAKSISDMRAAGKVYDPMAGAGPVQELRGPISVETPTGIAVMEGTQRNEISRPFEGQYMTQEQIDATTGARKKVGDPLTIGEANATGKETVGLIGDLARVKGAENVANINKSTTNWGAHKISQINAEIMQKVRNGTATPEEKAMAGIGGKSNWQKLRVPTLDAEGNPIYGAEHDILADPGTNQTYDPTKPVQSVPKRPRTAQEFVKAARQDPANAQYSDQDLIDYFNKTYGQ